MAKIVIGNVKGKDGRGISKIIKTASTGAVDTYTITYTDSTTSTFTINNSDSISLQRQIVPSAAVESSATASQAYAAGDYVVVNGALRKVKTAIAKGTAISDSNSTATTVTGELANFAGIFQDSGWKYLKNESIWKIQYRKVNGVVYLQIENQGKWTIDAKERRNLNEILPEGYRPSVPAFLSAYAFATDIGCNSSFVTPEGVISLYFGTQCDYFRCWCSYPV